MTKPIKYYALNKKQIHTLTMLFKFRFVTGSLLSSYKGLKRPDSLNQTFKILIAQDYVAKFQPTNDPFHTKGARYYLTPKAIKLLIKEHNIPEYSLRPQRRNNKLTEEFIDHHVEIMRAYIVLRDRYDEEFQIFTRSELAGHDYFPKPKPDMFLRREKRKKNSPDRYMLDICITVPLFIIKKRIKALIQHYDSGDWSDETNTDYPALLLVCKDNRIASSLWRYIRNILEDAGMDEELFFSTTTMEELLNLKKHKGEIWRKVSYPKEPVELLVA